MIEGERRTQNEIAMIFGCGIPTLRRWMIDIIDELKLVNSRPEDRLLHHDIVGELVKSENE